MENVKDPPGSGNVRGAAVLATVMLGRTSVKVTVAVAEADLEVPSSSRPVAVNVSW
jgi:hypothetical protein